MVQHSVRIACLLDSSFITRKDTLFLEDEIDSSGQKTKTRHNRSFTTQSAQSDASPRHRFNTGNSSNRILSGMRNFSSDDESDSSKNYGTFAGFSPGDESPYPKSGVANDCFYIRLQFADDFLTDTSDPDAQVIRREEYPTVISNTEVKKTLRALGETRKKAKDLVVGSTQFLVNTTEKIGSSLISLVNGEIRENPSAGTPVSSSSVLSGKAKRKFEPRHIPLLTEDTEVEVPEIRKNIDESD